MGLLPAVLLLYYSATVRPHTYMYTAADAGPGCPQCPAVSSYRAAAAAATAARPLPPPLSSEIQLSCTTMVHDN